MKAMETPPRLKLRIQMDQAAAAGRWKDHARLEKQWMDALLGKGGARADNEQQEPKTAMQPTDAEEPAPAPESDEIDWAKVAREAQAMVDLNKDAMSKWQKGSKAEQ